MQRGEGGAQLAFAGEPRPRSAGVCMYVCIYIYTYIHIYIERERERDYVRINVQHLYSVLTCRISPSRARCGPGRHFLCLHVGMLCYIISYRVIIVYCIISYYPSVSLHCVGIPISALCPPPLPRPLPLLRLLALSQPSRLPLLPSVPPLLPPPLAFATELLRVSE